MNAGVAAARGPFGFLLQTQTGQWLVLGLGAFTVFPDKCEEIVRPVLRSLILGFPNVPLGSDLSKFANGSGPNGPVQQAPIVIQTSGSASSKGEKIFGQLIGYTVTAAGVWVSYTILINYLPDWAKEMLPVTRQVFDKAVRNLGKGIVNCSEQILALMKKQDATHDELLEARADIGNLQESLDRCEENLENAEITQNKSARGIKLLVKAVATIVPGNHNIADELNQYAQEIDIDPQERGEYINAQRRNMSNPNFFTVNPTSQDSKFGKIIPTRSPRTPMTRSISEHSQISEISVDVPKGEMKMKVMDAGDVSYMSQMYSPVPSSSVSKRGVLPSSTLSMQNRIESLLNHGKIM